MSTTHQEFKNDTITATVTPQSGCSIKLDVTVSPLATQAAYEKAVKAISKEVSIPGFRKGKAPRETIIKMYARHVEKEWKELLLDTSFREAIQLIGIYPFNEKSVSKASIKDISLENGAKLAYEYESQPHVPSVSIDELSFKPVARLAITESDIANAIEALQFRHAVWNDVEARPVIEGDFVDLDVDAIETPSYNICKNHRFQVAPNKMGRWMRELIVGMKPGESSEKMSEKEDNDSECKACESGEEHEHHDHFKPTLCRITLNAIKTVTLPELNDEFSQKFGIQTIDELKERVEKDLNRQADEEQISAQRKAMESEILNKYVFEIPGTLVEQQMKDQTESILMELQEKGLEGATLKTEAEKVKQDVASRLDRDFRLYFLAKKIGIDHKIDISQEELNEELMHQIQLQGSGRNIIDMNMEPQEVRSRLVTAILLRKTMDYLIEQVQKKEIAH